MERRRRSRVGANSMGMCRSSGCPWRKLKLSDSPARHMTSPPNSRTELFQCGCVIPWLAWLQADEADEAVLPRACMKRPSQTKSDFSVWRIASADGTILFRSRRNGQTCSLQGQAKCSRARPRGHFTCVARLWRGSIEIYEAVRCCKDGPPTVRWQVHHYHFALGSALFRPERGVKAKASFEREPRSMDSEDAVAATTWGFVSQR
jgi:hypothetical protein